MSNKADRKAAAALLFDALDLQSIAETRRQLDDAGEPMPEAVRQSLLSRSQQQLTGQQRCRDQFLGHGLPIRLSSPGGHCRRHLGGR